MSQRARIERLAGKVPARPCPACRGVVTIVHRTGEPEPAAPGPCPRCGRARETFRIECERVPGGRG